MQSSKTSRRNHTKPISDDLMIFENGRTTPLPKWAMWFIELGKWIATEEQEKRQHWVVATIPDQRYASAFVSLGVVASMAERIPQIDNQKHFQYLTSLPLGTAVRYRSGMKVKYGKLLDIYERKGERYIRLTPQYSRSETKCSDIEPIERTNHSQTTKSLTDAPDFVQRALKIDDAGELTYRAHLGCSLIGVKKQVHCDLTLGLKIGTQEGHLQNLILAQSFITRQGAAHLTEIESATGKPHDFTPYKPRVVILDGPSAVLRWRSKVRAHSAVSLIDRCAPSAESAISELLAERAYSASETQLPEQPPISIDAIGFSFDRHTSR